MKVSIIIPCFNEETTISQIVKKILKLNFKDIEIIIIDDFSTDNTRKILNDEIKDKVDKVILNHQNFGKGFCIKEGVKHSTGDIILIQDADLEYEPSDYPLLINPIIEGYADVVYGSRFKSSQVTRVLYFWHTFGNKFLTFLSNCFTNLNLTDMEVCYKAFKSEVIKNITLEENRFGFEPEITAKISKKNYRIYEVGIKYFGRTYADGKKINWKDGFSAIRCILKYSLFKY